MSEQNPPPVPPTSEAPPPPPPAYAPSYGGQPVPAGYGPIGKVRSTGVCILLYIVTFGIYGLYWYFVQHEDMKRATGRGLGGVLALILALFVGFVMPFFTASEVGQMQEQAGRPKTVQGLTGLWILLPLVGAIVWFVKVNGALNEQWRSLGAQG